MSIPISHPKMTVLILGGSGVIVAVGVGVKDSVRVRVSVGVGVRVRVGMDVGVRVRVQVAVGVGLCVRVLVADGEAVLVTVPVRLGVLIAACAVTTAAWTVALICVADRYSGGCSQLVTTDARIATSRKANRIAPLLFASTATTLLCSSPWVLVLAHYDSALALLSILQIHPQRP